MTLFIKGWLKIRLVNERVVLILIVLWVLCWKYFTADLNILFFLQLLLRTRKWPIPKKKLHPLYDLKIHDPYHMEHITFSRPW